MTKASVPLPDIRIRETFGFGGCRWELVTNSHALAESVRWSLPAVDGTGAQAFRLELQVDEGRGARRLESPYFRGRDHLVMAAYSNADAMLFDLRRHFAAGRFSPGFAADREYWRRVVVPVLIGVASAPAGIAPLHCATLVRGRRGLHIFGLSGAGKSTLSVALAKRGFALLSDDWTYFSRQADSLWATGLPVPIKLLPEARRFFPELAQHTPAPSLNGELAFEVDPAETFQVRRLYSCQPGRVVSFQRIQGAAPAWKRVSPDEVEGQLRPALERIPGCLTRARSIQHQVIAELAQVPAYSLVCDGTPQEIADEIIAWLDGESECDDAAGHMPPSAPCDVPDLMRRFVPAPFAADFWLAGRRVRIDTDMAVVHEKAGHIAELLSRRYRGQLHCTIIQDSARCPDLSARTGNGCIYRAIAGLGCILAEESSGRVVAFISPACAATTTTLESLVSPA